MIIYYYYTYIPAAQGDPELSLRTLGYCSVRAQSDPSREFRVGRCKLGAN